MRFVYLAYTMITTRTMIYDLLIFDKYLEYLSGSAQICTDSQGELNMELEQSLIIMYKIRNVLSLFIVFFISMKYIFLTTLIAGIPQT